MISLESTTYPGCTEELLGDFFAKNLIIGESVLLDILQNERIQEMKISVLEIFLRS